MQRLLRSRTIQPKLAISQPGDIYEQEADRIADQVIATPAQHSVSGAPPRIQRFAGPSNEPMDAAPASVDQALASPGRPLEPTLRQDMEQRFGHDFSRVRVYTGAAAERSARDVNAHAYTVGHNVVFGAGRFAPGMHEGRQLIAHELTHVVQQGGAGQGGELTVRPDDYPYEQEAWTIAREVSAGHAVSGIHAIPSTEASVAPSRLQRQKKPAPPTPAQRLGVVEKQQKVAALDAEWYPKFHERMESYSAALWRISGAIEIANEGFRGAQRSSTI